MNVPTSVITPPSELRYYVDVTTRAINTNTGVTGNLDNFRTEIQAMLLDPGKKFTVEVESFNYQNVAHGAGVYPIILSDICEPIRVVNNTAGVLYKSSQQANDTDYYSRDITNNPTFVL